MQKCLLDRKRSYLTEKGLFSRKARRGENKLERIAHFSLDVFRHANMGRGARWEAACSELRGLLEEYQSWLDNLPDNLRGSPLAGKLEAMSEFENQIADLEAADLPQGFGRDWRQAI